MSNQQQIVRDFFRAFSTGDRPFIEKHIADGFAFSSPPDPYLDKDGYFERCWPFAGQGWEFDFVRIIESGDTVVVTYEHKLSDGTTGRNTEIFTFVDGKIKRVEVYFGWNEKIGERKG